MKKEEILEKSRKENKHKDLAEIELRVKANSTATGVGGILCCIIAIVELFTKDHINYAVWVIYFSMAFTSQLITYLKNKSRQNLILSIIIFIPLIIFIVFYILETVTTYNSMGWKMDEKLVLKNNLKLIRKEKKLSQSDLANLVGVSRNTISSIETGQFTPTAKLALILCIALDKTFEEIFYFD